jgi:mRNA-degrading endonuclease RelE of RelBE toxin-antitoxin system
MRYPPERLLADLEKLAPNIRKRIVNKIEWLAQNFEQITPQSLTGDWNANGEYRRLLVTIPRVMEKWG